MNWLNDYNIMAVFSYTVMDGARSLRHVRENNDHMITFVIFYEIYNFDKKSFFYPPPLLPE